jgi:hypothetical protein
MPKSTLLEDSQDRAKHGILVWKGKRVNYQGGDVLFFVHFLMRPIVTGRVWSWGLRRRSVNGGLRPIVYPLRCGKLASPPRVVWEIEHRSESPQRRPAPVARMMLPSFGILAIASSLLSLTAAHNIQMKAHMRECFHEQLHKDDKMTVTFQVGDREFGGSGNLEIDFWVRQNLPAILPRNSR